MNQAVRLEDELFYGGPPHRLQQSLRLIQPDEPRILRRAVLAGLIGWGPLVVLAAAQDSAFWGDRVRSLLFDFAVFARFLVAAPSFILAEAVCTPQLGRIVLHFLEAGLVPAADRHRFEAAITSTRRLRDSTTAEVLTLVLAYGMVVLLIQYVPSREFPPWHKAGGGEYVAFSFAGWWHALVSVPLLSVLFFGWLWRLFLWGRLLQHLSHLNLRLTPSHPDHAAGLKFVSYSLGAFSPLGFALGAIVAGFVANHIMYAGVSPIAYAHLIGGLAVGVALLFSGPLLLFSGKLLRVKRRGIFEYGALAGSEGRQFEQKWLPRAGSVDEEALSVPDFSATADLYGVVGHVYEMGTIPLDLRNLVSLIIATLLPFVPVALMTVPLDVIVAHLVGLLL